MRDALARTLYELARGDERIIVLVADISPAGAMEVFRREFPSRFINVGVAEQAMVGLAAGLAQRGYKPFCYTIATFALFRPYEFIRCDLAYQNLPVTVIGMGAGLSYPTLGGTHQAVEDVAVAMAMPNLTVLAPCDPRETAECARWCAETAGDGGRGPVYMRIGKAGEPDLPERKPVSRRGAIKTLVLSYGPIAAEALRVAEVIDARMATVCRLAPASELGWCEELVSRCDRVIVVEEASGAPLATALRASCSALTEILSFALPREFPHGHGTRQELLSMAGLTAEQIIASLGGKYL